MVDRAALWFGVADFTYVGYFSLARGLSVPTKGVFGYGQVSWPTWPQSLLTSDTMEVTPGSGELVHAWE